MKMVFSNMIFLICFIFSFGSVLFAENSNSKASEKIDFCQNSSSYYVSLNNKDCIIPSFACTNKNCGKVWTAATTTKHHCPKCGSKGRFIGY